MRKAKTGDIYSVWNDETEKWFVLQVIKEDKNKVAIISIDAFFDNIPAEKDLKDLKPLIVSHHNWKGDYDCKYINTNIVPERIKFIANIQPIINIEEINTYSIGWPKEFLQAVLQYKWNILDKKLTAAYKQAIKSEDSVLIGNKEFKIRNISIYLNETDNLPINQLNKLPALCEINFTGTTNELIPFTEKNPLISKLNWQNHQQKKIDLSKTKIKELIIGADGLEYLILNNEIRTLSFMGDFSQLENIKIDHPFNGKFLGISLFSKNDFLLPNFKLTNLQKLHMRVNRIDFRKIAEFYPNIKSLKIWGNPGCVDNFKSLSEFKYLEDFQLNNLFGYSSEDLPQPEDMPNLEFLWLTSIPRDVGQEAKKRFKHVSNLSVTKLRNEKWLTENLNNPFRDWDGREGISSANAKKAFNAFKKLNSVIEKKPSEKEIENAFSAFIDVFNIMNKKSLCIETIEREEIYEIYMSLAEKVQGKKDFLFDLFENSRDF